MQNRLTLGVLFTLISAFTYAILTALVKQVSADIPTPIIVFIQSTVCLLLFIPFLLLRDKQASKQSLKVKKISVHILRTIMSLGISYFLFYSVKYIPLVDGVLLANTAPLLVPFLGLLLLRQRINHRMWLPLIVGFMGVVLVLRPDTGVFNPASLLALCAGICMATSMIFVRKAAATDSSYAAIFYYFLFSTIISGLVAIHFWVPLSMMALFILIFGGILFFIVQISLVYALANTNAQVVSSVYLANIIFATLLSMWIWPSHLDLLLIGGIILTIIGAIWCIREQTTMVIE